MKKISKKDQDPQQIHSDNEGIKRIMSKKSQHFEPGTWVVLNGVRYLILCYRHTDGKMILDSGPGGTTIAVESYSMRWRKFERRHDNEARYKYLEARQI